MSEWISVKDRLPEGDGFVLVYWKRRFILRNCDDLSHPSGIEPVLEEWLRIYGHPFVTHWMPLPEPPKESKCTPQSK